jgi:hypothetical protein
MAQTSDAIPRVLLVGRLALYGPGAARLHEELISITARWVDPKIRKGMLAPYSRDAESRTLTLLDSALLEKHARQVPEVVLRQLQESAARDVQELLPHLESRSGEYAREAIASLAKRAESESKAMTEILETQKKHIEETVTKHDKNAGRYWGKRLSDLATELKTEPDRIRNLYEVRAQRIEPVGLIYLWPVTR